MHAVDCILEIQDNTKKALFFLGNRQLRTTHKTELSPSVINKFLSV